MALRPFHQSAIEALVGDPPDPSIKPSKSDLVEVFEEISDELDATDAAIAGLGTLGVPTVPVIMGTRTNAYTAMFGNTSGDGAQTNTTSHARLTHFTPNIGTTFISDLQLVYGNWYLDYSNPTVTERAGTIAITVRASVYSALLGVWVPVFFNGARDVTIEPGATVVSDPLGVDLTENTQFWTMTRVEIATTAGFESWPTGRATYSTYGEGVLSTDSAAADYTTSPGSGYTVTVSGSTTSAVPENTALAYGPLMILGRAAETLASVVIFGDSIGDGADDAGSNGLKGHLARALDNYVPWAKYTRPGDSYLNRGTVVNHYRMFSSIGGRATHALIQLGTNDIYANGRTLTQAQNEARSLFRQLAARGITIVACTIPPVTTSTDGWTTTVNQTISDGTKNTTRVSWNNWLRLLDGTTIDGATITVADVADAVETARDSGIWKANYTQDGIHMLAAGATAAAAAVDLADFGVTP